MAAAIARFQEPAVPLFFQVEPDVPEYRPKLKIGIIYNEPLPPGQAHWESSADILAQVAAVDEALKSLGHTTARIPFTRALGDFIAIIEEEAVECVFNLCESVDEDPTLIWHPAAVLELLGVAFSGSPSAALMLTSDKVLTKRLLKAAGVRTPRFVSDDGLQEIDPKGLRFPVIVKPRFEDASIGIDQDSIFEDERSLTKSLDAFRTDYGPLLVEEYIDGREFNISLFGYPQAKVLPLAEIDFSAFPENLYAIVGYRAKWDAASFEYRHTPRTFPESLPRALRIRLQKTVLDSYAVFQLRDYGRVDLRLDERGNVNVLEVNANPCLSPDAGLAAAFCKSGPDYVRLIEALVDFTAQRTARDARPGRCRP